MTHTRFVSVIVVMLSAASLSAGPIVPAGLNPGDHYHLAFVTANSTNASSTNIATYNAFVNAEAALAPSLTGTDVGVQWFVIGSTSAVHARDNAVVGANAPIFLVDGTTLVATGFADFWDGSLLSPIFRHPTGTASSGEVFTGSDASGFASLPFGGSQVMTGHSSASDAGWIERDMTSFGSGRRFYALSEKLMVPIPEPGSATMLLIGCGGLLAWTRRRPRPHGLAAAVKSAALGA